MLNSKYDPFSLKLKGWAEQMNSGITDYHDVLGELYEKYNKPGKGMAPEIKLLLMVTGGAMQFHLTHTYLGNMPTLNTTLEQDPQLAEMLRQQAIANKIKQDSQQKREDINKKVFNAHENVAKNIENRNDNLAFIKQKELEKMKMEQMRAQQNIQLAEIKKNLAQGGPNMADRQTQQNLNLSPRPQMSQMPQLPQNTTGNNNTSNVQQTLQIPPSIAKMMEKTELKKAEAFQQQTELLKTQKKSG